MRFRGLGFALAAIATAMLPATAWTWQRSSPSDVGALAVDGAGDALVAGSRVADNGAASLFSVRKFSGTDGAQLWSQDLQGDAGSGNGGLAVTTTPAGDVLAGGTMHDATSGGDLAVVKLSGSTGAQIWKTVIDGAADDGFVLSLDVAMALATDSAGGVLVAGTLADVAMSTATQFVVLKMDGATGAESWRASLGDGYASAVVVDSSGDVVVAGVLGGGAGADLAVAKLAGADGAELWRVVIDGSANSADQANALALDAADDVIVAGALDNAGTDDDFFVAKLAGTDGAEMWWSETDGPGVLPPANLDRAKAVAVDASGDVVAGGFLGSVASRLDLAVSKLSGSDGSELWRYEADGADSALDQDDANALGVDAAGDVVAVGTLLGTGGTRIFTIVKLDGTSGEARWLQQIPSEPGSGTGRLLALDPAGNAIAAGDLLGAGFVVKAAEVLAGRKAIVKDPGPFARRLVKLSSADRGVLVPAAGGDSDPTAADSVLQIRNPVTAETASLSLPATHWQATASGYRYTDSAAVSGPCTLVDVSAGRALKVKCKGFGIGFSLDEATQGVLTATLTLGDNGPRYCLRFGGTIVRDAGGPTGGSFIAKNSPASASCVGP